MAATFLGFPLEALTVQYDIGSAPNVSWTVFDSYRRPVARIFHFDRAKHLRDQVERAKRRGLVVS